MKNKLLPIFISLGIIFTLFAASLISSTRAAATFAGGNIVDGANATAGATSYSDPVTASAGNDVVIRIQVINLGDTAATNTIVTYNLSNPSAPTASVRADGVSAQTDFVNISPSGVSLDYVEGSAKMYGPSCTAGCTVGDEVVTSGLNIGTVNPGDTNSYQLRIRATVVGQPGATNRPVFRGGNMFDGGVQGITWADPVSANPGQVVEFRVTVINEGAVVARNTTVRAAFPTNPANPIVPSAFISAESADTVSDNFTINVIGGSSQSLTYWPGHAIKWGPGCVNGCALADNIHVEGVNIGDVAPGVTNSVQVTFKAYLTGPTPTPTPTATPTATPTSTPTSTPTATPTGTPTATPTGTATPTATPTVTPTPTPTGTPRVLATTAPAVLPRTGPELFLAGPAILPLAGVGIYLKKRFRLK